MKIKVGFLKGIVKFFLKFTWKCKRPRIAKTPFKKKNKIGGIVLCDFRTYFIIAVIKIVW